MSFSLGIYLCAVSLLLIPSTRPQISKEPSVFAVLFVRNKEHTLPYFLQLFEQLDYPKDRIGLWIKTDNNQDRTLEILQKWIPSVNQTYHFVEFSFNSTTNVVENPVQWSSERFRHMIEMKQEALERAHERWADFVWYIDSDVFLTNPQTLRNLVKTNHVVVAPMLESLGLYSNFWCGMGQDFYYRRTDEYKPIRERQKKGCFQVILVHSCFLVNLRYKDSLKLNFRPEGIYGYDGPEDDIITFAVSAYWQNISVHVCNDEKYGYIMVPLEDNQDLKDDAKQLLNVKLDASVDFPHMEVHPLLKDFVTYPEKDKLGFDEVFMINLDRRPERRERMEWCFNEIGVDFKRVEAVDGRQLNDSYLDALGIEMLPNFADPYHKRPMTLGEVGCFLSHYNIWKEIVERKLDKSVIFEDDIRFEPYFREKVERIFTEIDRLELDWDLIYLGRKRLQHQNETWLEGSEVLSTVGYSYWTLSYMVSYRGAQKLLDGKPLEKLVPVDEYIPIMFNRHPETRWMEPYSNRNLKAYSAAPLVVYPTHYTGEGGYISDTEASAIVSKGTDAAGKELEAKGAKEPEPSDVTVQFTSSLETSKSELHIEL